ncbi:transcriptional regulator [Prolixibacter bellariivorans]|uniref:Transcriptional regulator n=1 Tax=Prolixibacter bellariivorans TaxID=314319 RepID=A0A5M4B3S4_9BACT|nr:helix-turn-helix transcriptional regulator [Prolixibacter bellariivorans]GET34568.1 transcriptional regulator [Prolixibacter bellariivorans]
MDMTETAPAPKVHHGRNIKRLREMLGVKQEYIASELNLTQQTISKLEQKEVIEDDMLEKVAKTLNVPTDAIKNLSDDAATNYINTFYDNHGHGFFANNVNFNPIDKVVELYERLLAAEKDKVAMMEKLMEGRK